MTTKTAAEWTKWQGRIMWLLFTCYIVSIALVIFIFVVVYRRLDMTELPGQTFAVRLMQATLGMLVGATFAIMGVIAVWIGLKEASEVSVEGWGKAAAAGPGTILVLCGTVIICMCLLREFRITERTGSAPKIRNLTAPNTSQDAP
jgi:hypothetical protein